MATTVAPDVKATHRQSVLNRLRTVRGHVEAVIGMVEEERYCVDIMKQVSAMQGSLERVNRTLLENHLQTCVTDAITEGHTDQVIDELMDTLKYTGALTGPSRGTT